ncbi:hypothetical protein PF008_g4467 [Phytophthora fragariae]|uniref:GST C-terminal domain-containing protein n=1 Tax=Phytophthora fragariae TaxID=53985 RepID=A0A6G0SD57_9STRA|nr:hypothetical protein PF008_g4467 [Phytophthora fragariae]
MALQTLENHLHLRTYLLGEPIYLADIVVASAFVYPFKYVLDKKFRKPYSTVNRRLATVVNQPEFQDVVGDVPLIDVTLACLRATTLARGMSEEGEDRPEGGGPQAQEGGARAEPDNTKKFMTCNAVGGFLQRSEDMRKCSSNPSYVLDCIDDVKTKCALMESVTRKNLKVITEIRASAMGRVKVDPTRLQIWPLKDAVRNHGPNKAKPGRPGGQEAGVARLAKTIPVVPFKSVEFFNVGGLLDNPGKPQLTFDLFEQAVAPFMDEEDAIGCFDARSFLFASYLGALF